MTLCEICDYDGAELWDKLDAAEEELESMRPEFTCNHCREGQQDWLTLLRHYDTCPQIKRARSLNG